MRHFKTRTRLNVYMAIIAWMTITGLRIGVSQDGTSGDTANPDAFPQDVADGIVKTLSRRFPKADIACDQSEIRLTQQMLEYRTHGNGKVLEYLTTSRETSGPAYEGFDLRLEFIKDQEEQGAAGAGLYGRKGNEDYWIQYVNVYRLHEKQGRVVLNYEHGAAADNSILNEIKSYLVPPPR